MTPEQITIRGAKSGSDLCADAYAAAWCVRCPDSLNVEEDASELKVGPDAALPARVGAFRIFGVLVLIVALVAYLVVPFNTFIRAQIREQGPTRARPIPASPQHESVRLGA